jgi:hypothetical protein
MHAVERSSPRCLPRADTAVLQQWSIGSCTLPVVSSTGHCLGNCFAKDLPLPSNIGNGDTKANSLDSIWASRKETPSFVPHWTAGPAQLSSHLRGGFSIHPILLASLPYGCLFKPLTNKPSAQKVLPMNSRIAPSFTLCVIHSVSGLAP